MLRSNLWRVLGLLVFIPLVHGWGKEGHIATCKIAQGYLTDAAAAGVQKLLPPSAQGDFSSVCPWADTQRFRYYWSRPLHIIDTPDNECDYEYCNNLTEALMFLAHFIGDVHQPLNVGFKGDAGGSLISLNWYKRKSNLNYVWNRLIIETAMNTYYNRDLTTMVQSIQANVTDNSYDDISTWDDCNEIVCPEPFASESVKLACEYAYKGATPGVTLGDEYFDSRLPIVEKRLAQGGVRLANVLNRIFDPSIPYGVQSHPSCNALPIAAE